MKQKLTVFIALFYCVHFCLAQDTTIVLSASMFDKNFQVIRLGNFNGWIFRQGNDSTWAKTSTEVAGWKKIKPAQLTVRNGGKNGRVEGWFRLRFRLDSSFQNMGNGIISARWAATEIYIDGRQVASFGNTGKAKLFKEYRGVVDPPVSLNLLRGVDYLLAVHLVIYPSPLKPSLLTTEAGGSHMALVTFTGPETSLRNTNFYREFSSYFSAWAAVCGVLSLLFWFLYFQNSTQRSLLFISLSTTAFSAGMFCTIMRVCSTYLTFVPSSLFGYGEDLFYGVAYATTVLVLAHVFRRQITFGLKLFVCIMAFSFLFNSYFFNTRFSFLIAIALLTVCLYFVVSSWKSLRGAQSVVVIGVLVSMVSYALFAYFVQKYAPVFPFPFAYLYLTGGLLSLPLSLMVYVALRFKEMLNEVQEKAKQVLQLSEEKKEQALNQQKILEKEVAKQTVELRTAFENLKNTQSQLIQSEKMASLGELTAGIAHEIQNPLNFINNFSEVNKELLEELKDEAEKGNLGEVKVIANDLIDNEEKISHHGKRADAIVKGMLQHSRASSGKKEPTDINALADEYLRLSYHGLRAKDKDFNAVLNTYLNGSIGKIEVVPQDIGRVLLNLFNNAFYAVSERCKAEGGGYKPTLSLSTKKADGKIQICIKDNGNGIPPKVVDKIFQPFFTTKPTGQGTGLGLSLSYDIIKAHGGEIKVETKAGEGAQFIVQLPI